MSVLVVNVADPAGIERLYPREIWEHEAALNTVSGQTVLRGLRIDSVPDEAGNFMLLRAAHHVGEAGPHPHSIFLVPQVTWGITAFTEGDGAYGAVVETAQTFIDLASEYRDFIERVLKAAREAHLLKIPGRGDVMPLG